MGSFSSSSASVRAAKRSKSNPKAPIQRSPFTDFGSYMEAKNRKLRYQFETESLSSSILNGDILSSRDGKGIFHGVSIFVDGHTVPSFQELKGYMLKHGGRFENYFSRSHVTHIICSNLPDSKMRNLRAFSKGLPVLKPAWVVDCVVANQLLSWIPYQLSGHSNETYKEQKIFAFFGCKGISNLKDTKIVSDCNEGTDSEDLEKKESPLPLESMVLDQKMMLSEGVDVALDKETKYTMLKKGTKDEQSVFSAEHLSVQFNSCVAEGSVEPTITRCLQISDVHHSTITDPNFVENYFKHSRLHFIGTWRNRYRKRFCNVLKGECRNANVDSSSSSPNKTFVIHIDMDCFFVSVILRKHPELFDKPVAVCHSSNSRGTAEISSANYPARSYGIHAGMFVRDAKSCCPNLVIFPYDFEAYEEVADQFYSILHKHCNKVQALSCDEAFLDISEFSDLDLESFVSMIRKEIVETTQCTATAGIGGNLLMARLATKNAKPDGQCFIPPEKVETFLDDLPITSLPGIGRAIGDKMEYRQIHTCGQLRLISKESLYKDFGAKVGEMLWNYCRGIDDRKVEVLKETKSIGAEVNWGIRFRCAVDFERFLIDLSKEVSSRLQECDMVARTINLKLKRSRKGANEPVKFMGCGDCENMSRSITLPDATDDVTLIQRIAKKIFASYHIDVKEIRGVGLQMSRLEIVDANRKGHKHNVLESWLTVSAKVGEDSVRIDNRNNFTVTESSSSSEEDRLDVQHNGAFHEYSHLCVDRSASSDALHANLCNSSSYENANPALPPVFLLDMSVIKDLPVEIISEVNDAYNGKLYDLMRKHVEDQSNTNLLTPPLEDLRRKAPESEATKTTCSTSYELNLPKKPEISEMPHHQVEQAGFCCGLNILQIKSAICPEDQMDLASGSSSEAFSFLQNLSDNAILDKPAPAQVPNYSASIAGDTPRNIPNHIGSKESEKSKINLWSGSPPKWVGKFEVSSCLILNLTAQLYTEFGADNLLSPILQLLISLYPHILGSSIEGPSEAHFDLCELLLQYINLKIDYDIEELYLCCLLMERLASLSTVFSEVHKIFLPSLQVSVSENYGGTLQLIGRGD